MSNRFNRIIRNFTYPLNELNILNLTKLDNDSDAIAVSESSALPSNSLFAQFIFFLTELNKQLNALVNSDIYIENKEQLDEVLKSKSDFRTELLRLLKTVKYIDFYKKIYFDAEIYGNKAKYFRTVIEDYRRILLSRSHRQTIIAMIEKHIKNENNSISQLAKKVHLNDKSYLNKLYHKIFNEICSHNDKCSTTKQLNWISKAEFHNIIKEIVGKATNDKDNSERKTEAKIDKNNINVYAIDYSSEDQQISEFKLTDKEAHYLIEFKMKYSNCLTKSDSLLTYQCKVPKKQIKGLTTGYTKLKKITRPRIFLNTNDNKLYISFNYELISSTATRSYAVLSENKDESAKAAIATNVNNLSTDNKRNCIVFKSMGVDVGVAKSATAAIVIGEGEAEVTENDELSSFKITNVAISDELTVSDHAKYLSKRIGLLKTEQKNIFRKEKIYEKLLKLNTDIYSTKSPDSTELIDLTNSIKYNDSVDNDLYKRYERLKNHRLHLRHKSSNLKKELACITARDMISHAIDNYVDLITLEQLNWIRDKHHTTWDYSQIQQRIIYEANVYGIKVRKVPCTYSSKRNPLTLEKEEVDKNRTLVKCLFDRDHAAAIILARRGFTLIEKIKLFSDNVAIEPEQLNNFKQLHKLPLQIKMGSHDSQSSNFDYNLSCSQDSFHAVNCSIKPSLYYRYRQLNLLTDSNLDMRMQQPKYNLQKFANYSVL